MVKALTKVLGLALDIGFKIIKGNYIDTEDNRKIIIEIVVKLEEEY